MNPIEASTRHREMAHEYAAGDTMDVIAFRHGVSKSTVRYAINTHGVKMRPSGRSKKENPLKPSPRSEHRPVCCGIPTVPIEHPVSGLVLRHLCFKCWRSYE